MNLIEQLGGYEKANSKLLKMDKILKEVYFSYSDAKKADDLRSALLEHRRANNIFEVGDLVVFSDYFMHDEIMAISKIDGCEMWMDDDAKWTHNFNEMIRHAEPQEIEAGRRL